MPKPRRHGQWWVTEASGKLHQLCPADRTFEQARDALTDYLAQLKQEREGGLVEVHDLTVATLVDEFLTHKAATKGEGTLDYYRFYLTRFTEWYGDRNPRKLKLSDGTAFIGRLKAIESITSNSTVNHYITAAKSVFNFGVDNDRLLKNPWKKLKKLPETGRQRIVTEEEFDKLLKACDGCIAYRGLISAEDNRQMMRDVLHIMRYTALRPGELRKLRWDHLHLERGFIIIPAHEHKTGTTAKNPEDRIIPVLDEGERVLRARQERWGHQARVFSTINGGEWNDSDFSRRFERLRKRAGLDEPDHNGEKLTWYSLRHTRLSEAATDEGWDFYTLMAYAGHTTPAMTKRYVHPKMENLRRLAQEGEQKRKAAAKKPAENPTAG